MVATEPLASSRTRLALQALLRYVFGLVAFSALLFGSAGTLDYWQAKLFLGSVFGCKFLCGLFFLWAAPDIMERRLRGKEERRAQRIVMSLAHPFTAARFIIPGLARRWGRQNVPEPVVYASLPLVLAATLGMYYVFWCNRFAGRTIVVEKPQKVVSTGPYAYVRHPMYSFMIVNGVFAPMSLGSYHGAILCTPPAIAMLIYRLLDEEEALKKNLDGYADYMVKVPYRLIPHVY
jgi:protein-S-isoprenylcysteine O-methyltransferase Ste14